VRLSAVFVTADVDLSGEWREGNTDALVRYEVRSDKAVFVS
jgi:hypothetical protein